MLPGLLEEEVLKKSGDIPVIVVSTKADINDKVKMLKNGAQDYMTKPFSARELLARVEVQLRGLNDNLTDRYTDGDITMDNTSHSVMVKNRTVSLTKTEYAILKLLMQNPNQVISKTVILERIFEDTPDCTDRSLKQHISNLRKKLRDTGDKEYIEAVWGIGFKITF